MTAAEVRKKPCCRGMELSTSDQVTHALARKLRAPFRELFHRLLTNSLFFRLAMHI